MAVLPSRAYNPAANLSFRKITAAQLPFVTFLLLYCCVLMLLLPRLPLWLDEIRDLTAASSSNFSNLLASLKSTPGSVPLGYFAQALAVRMLGLSEISGRLPSAIASVFGCVGVYVLASHSGARFPVIAMLTFAICPLQLRYALEARGYELGLALVIWSTVIFLHTLNERSSARWSVPYGVCVLAGLYTQPFSVFVPFAHWIWLFLNAHSDFRKRLRIRILLILAICAVFFLPWYAYTAGSWKASLLESHVSAHIAPNTFLLVLHELTGAGYIGTALLIAAIVAAVWFPGKGFGGFTSFFLFCFLLPIACTLLADFVFGYFVAIRQMIFILGAAFVLFTLGLERVSKISSRAAAVLLISLCAAYCWGDFAFFFRRPHENWVQASALLAGEVNNGSCAIFSPPDSKPYYSLFQPQLDHAECEKGSSGGPSRIALAISSNDSYDVVRVRKELAGRAFVLKKELNPQGPRVEIYELTPQPVVGSVPK